MAWYEAEAEAEATHNFCYEAEAEAEATHQKCYEAEAEAEANMKLFESQNRTRTNEITCC